MKKTTILMTLFLVSALLLTACGGDEAPESVDTVVDSSETDTDTDSDGIGVGNPGPATIDLDAQEAFDPIDSDYELHLVLSFDGGPDHMGEFVMEQKQSIDSLDWQIMVTGSGIADLDEADSVEAAILGETLYFYQASLGCSYLPAFSYDDPFQDFVYSSETMNGNVDYVGTATINGVATWQYRIEESNIDPQELELASLESGSLYVAQEGNYVVRLVFEGSGTNELFGGDGSVIGDIHYQLDFVPVDQVEIEIPEGCELIEDGAGGAGDSAANTADYPVLPDASNVAAFGLLFSYESSTAIDAAVDFYKSELAADGWTLSNEVAAGETALLTFEQGGRALSVALNVDTSGSGVLNVVIIEEQ